MTTGTTGGLGRGHAGRQRAVDIHGARYGLFFVCLASFQTAGLDPDIALLDTPCIACQILCHNNLSHSIAGCCFFVLCHRFHAWCWLHAVKQYKMKLSSK